MVFHIYVSVLKLHSLALRLEEPTRYANYKLSRHCNINSHSGHRHLLDWPLYTSVHSSIHGTCYTQRIYSLVRFFPGGVLDVTVLAISGGI